jgi:proton-translocating NADH-quinone oxidoreductase chain N
LFQGLVGIDTATSLVKLFILIVSCGCLFISSDYLDKSRLGCFEFFVLYLLCVFGVMFFISSLDLFMLFLALEIQGICFYALVAINRNSGYCAEAGIKYFVLGAFSSGVLLFGISMIYGATGTTNMLSIFHFLQNLDLVLIKDMLYLYSDFSNPIFITNSKLVLGFLFMFIGFLFKVTAAPFHMWAPDIYEGAPFATVVFISTVPKIAVFFYVC